MAQPRHRDFKQLDRTEMKACESVPAARLAEDRFRLSTPPGAAEGSAGESLDVMPPRCGVRLCRRAQQKRCQLVEGAALTALA